MKPGYRFLISFALGFGAGESIGLFVIPDWPLPALVTAVMVVAYVVARWTRACLNARYEDRS